MLVKLKAFGGKLKSDVMEVPKLNGDRLNIPYYDPYIQFWKEPEPPKFLPGRHLVFEYRGESEQLPSGELIRILQLVDW